MKTSLTFLGGAQTVTGSKFLYESPEGRILIDCGLFQGLKDLRLRNRAHFSVDPSSIHAVILTHAHLDHSGYLPALVRGGFKGKIYCTPPTRDLAEVLLYDSAHIQDEDAAYANRKGFSRHHPAQPLYTTQDVKHTLTRFVTIAGTEWSTLLPGIRFRLTTSGHILGSAFVELEEDQKITVFSGDLGREKPLLLRPPSRIKRAHTLVVESTYGDRNHPLKNPEEELTRIVLETLARGGKLIIPSFAVGRAQELLFLFSRLIHSGKIPQLPVYLDSPMGESVTRIFHHYSKWHRLNEQEVDGMMRVAQAVGSQEESKRIMRDPSPSIVIAGSGMAAGGRVLHHLGACLPDERNSVLLVGYQAVGTRGRLLLEGASELKFHGAYVPVHAKIESMGSLSAHADQRELLAWLKGFEQPPQMTCIVHGELQASEALLLKIRDVLGWDCRVPAMEDTVILANH